LKKNVPRSLFRLCCPVLQSAAQIEDKLEEKLFMSKMNHSVDFQENRSFFRRKWRKIVIITLDPGVIVDCSTVIEISMSTVRMTPQSVASGSNNDPTFDDNE
jgi:hypothetical protein